MNNKLVFLGLFPVFMLLVPNAYASFNPNNSRDRVDCDSNGDHSWCNGGRGRDGLPFCDLNIPAEGCYDREDNSEDYCEEYSQSDLEFCMDVEKAVTCYNEGYDDGQNHPFNQRTYEECGDIGFHYENAFIEGCMPIEGNAKETCESFTDD
ncbi:MAG: hypothetical protein WBL44_00485 [Nitrososphaeraceae archaeon]